MPLRLHQALCIYAAITERTICRCILIPCILCSFFRLRRDGKLHSPSGSHRPRLSVGYPVASVFITAFFVICNLCHDTTTSGSICQEVFPEKNRIFCKLADFLRSPSGSAVTARAVLRSFPSFCTLRSYPLHSWGIRVQRRSISAPYGVRYARCRRRAFRHRPRFRRRAG